MLGFYHKLSPCCQPLSVVKVLGPKGTLCETLFQMSKAMCISSCGCTEYSYVHVCIIIMLFQYFEYSTLLNEFFSSCSLVFPFVSKINISFDLTYLLHLKGITLRYAAVL